MFYVGSLLLKFHIPRQKIHIGWQIIIQTLGYQILRTKVDRHIEYDPEEQVSQDHLGVCYLKEKIHIVKLY